MDVGEVGDGGFEVYWPEFEEIRGRKFTNNGILFDVAGDGDVNKSADTRLDDGTGTVDNGFGFGGVKNHGIVATGKGVFGSENGEREGFGFAGFDNKFSRRDLNPGSGSPTVVFFINIGIFNLDRSTRVIDNNKVFDFGGKGAVDTRLVSNFDLEGFNFTGVNFNFKPRGNGGDAESRLSVNSLRNNQ